MSAKKRKRDVPVLFWVSDAEMEAIQQKMAQFGTKNLSAYLRKMAVDGYVVQLDLPELKELVSLLRRSSNNRFFTFFWCFSSNPRCSLKFHRLI